MWEPPPRKAGKSQHAAGARRGGGRPAARAVLPGVPAPDAHRAQQGEITSAHSRQQLSPWFREQLGDKWRPAGSPQPYGPAPARPLAAVPSPLRGQRRCHSPPAAPGRPRPLPGGTAGGGDGVGRAAPRGAGRAAGWRGAVGGADAAGEVKAAPCVRVRPFPRCGSGRGPAACRWGMGEGVLMEAAGAGLGNSKMAARVRGGGASPRERVCAAALRGGCWRAGRGGLRAAGLARAVGTAGRPAPSGARVPGEAPDSYHGIGPELPSDVRQSSSGAGP